MEPFNKDTMQNAMIRAGVTPRDLVPCMPCHAATLYNFLKTGRAKSLTEFQFEKLYRFLGDASDRGILPANGEGSPELRRRAVQRAFNFWQVSGQSLEKYETVTEL